MRIKLIKQKNGYDVYDIKGGKLVIFGFITKIIIGVVGYIRYDYNDNKYIFNQRDLFRNMDSNLLFEISLELKKLNKNINHN